jgi:hypothetical protein
MYFVADLALGKHGLDAGVEAHAMINHIIIL